MKSALRNVTLWLAVLFGVIGLLGLQGYLDGGPDQDAAAAYASRPA